MTEQDWIELGRRAVACKGWRWMPGMLALDSTAEEHPARVIDARRSVVYEDTDGAIHEAVVSRSDVPDLRDAATLGCVLALVREAWNMPRLALVCSNGRWRVIIDGLDVRFPIRAPARNNTEAAALVAALWRDECPEQFEPGT